MALLWFEMNRLHSSGAGRAAREHDEQVVCFCPVLMIEQGAILYGSFLCQLVKKLFSFHLNTLLVHKSFSLFPWQSPFPRLYTPLVY